MKRQMTCAALVLGMLLLAVPAWSAYHHMGEQDGPRFQQAYPDLVGTRVDDCVLCHSGGEYEKKPGKWVTVGSCQWCHMTYGYDGSGDIDETLNPYGQDYQANGRNSTAFSAIEQTDSDGDGYSNIAELNAMHFPGNDADYPGLATAPSVVFSLAELQALTQHQQFMLMNTSRGGSSGYDAYVTYGGVKIEDLMEAAGMRSLAEGITAFAPDGWSTTYPLEPATGAYWAIGAYPQAMFYYDSQADAANGGWVKYDSPGCTGRQHGQPIVNAGGLHCMLAYSVDGAALEPGLLNDENKLDGEGPFRLVVPQWNPGPPDQQSTDPRPGLPWEYDEDEITTDHNAGSSARTVTAIRVEPLPEGTTDFDWYEGGWNYVDTQQVVIYGLLRSGTIQGVVTDTEGNPLARARVSTDIGGYQTLTTDNGSYEISGIACGSDTRIYRVTARKPGYLPRSCSVEVSNKETLIQDFELAPFECPIAATIGDTSRTTIMLRQLRDGVLAAEPLGRDYVDLFYGNAEALGSLWARRPLAKLQAVVAMLLCRQPVADLVSGKPARLNRLQLRCAQRVLASFAQSGDDGLAAVAQRIRSDLRTGALTDAFGIALP